MSGASLQKYKKCRKVVVTGSVVTVVVKALSNPRKKRTLKKKAHFGTAFSEVMASQAAVAHVFLGNLKDKILS